MKKMIVAALALCLAGSAFAGIGLDWNTQSFGIYVNGSSGTDYTAVDELALSHSDVLWQLIFSTDSKADPIDLDNAEKGYVSGDDSLLKQRLISQAPSGSEYYDEVSASDGTSWFVNGINAGGTTSFIDEDWTTAGYVYQRVFGASAPDEGVYYLETVPEALDTTWTKMVPANGLYIDSESQGAVLSEQIPGPEPQVPEPATMSLLGLGALAMVLRRKLRK